MSVPVNITQAKQFTIDIIKAGLVTMLQGPPGLGKSAMMYEIAKEFNLKVIDMRLAQCDPTDLSGLISFTKTGRATYTPMDTFPLEGDEIPAGYAGWLLFLDEINAAAPAVQSASYKIVLDKKVGQHNLHKKVAIVCAGNLLSDNAIVHEMSTALQSRLIHLELAVDADAWLEGYAIPNNIDHRITSWIKHQPDALHKFDPDHSDYTFPSPRTWTFCHKIINKKPVDYNLVPLLAGTIGEGMARSFVGFCQIYKDMLTVPEIIANPQVPIPQEKSVLFALTGSISVYITDTNAEALMIFINRLPIEFQIICLRDMVRRNKAIIQNKAIQKWVEKNANELF